MRIYATVNDRTVRCTFRERKHRKRPLIVLGHTLRRFGFRVTDDDTRTHFFVRVARMLSLQDYPARAVPVSGRVEASRLRARSGRRPTGRRRDPTAAVHRGAVVGHRGAAMALDTRDSRGAARLQDHPEDDPASGTRTARAREPAARRGSVRNSVFGPLWPGPVVPAVRCHCSSSALTERSESPEAARRLGPKCGTERYPRAVHGCGPLTGPSAGGQAVDIAGHVHGPSTTKRSPKRIANSGRAWCQNSGGARHPSFRRRSAR